MKKSVIDSLSTSPLFKGLGTEELIKLTNEYMSVRICEKNEIIISETNYTRALGIIIKGSASVIKHSGQSEILMSILKKGDIFGMATLFHEEENYLTEIRAKEKVTMAVFSKEDVRKMLSFYPQVNENYITILSEKIHFLNNKISTYTRAENIRKVAFFIIQNKDDKKMEVTLPYSITKFADALGVGRASVYRAFETLESENVISRDGKKITILDFSALEKYK